MLYMVRKRWCTKNLALYTVHNTLFTKGREVAKSKSPPKRYRIGEVAEHSKVPKTTLNHWITMGLLKRMGKSDGGHRVFDEEVFDRINVILKGRKAGKSLEEIREGKGWG